MTSSERLQWGAIGAAFVAAAISLIVGYSSMSQNEEFKASDLSSRIGVLEERTRTLDIAAIKRELENIRRDQALLVTKSVNQERFSVIEKRLRSFSLQLNSFKETSSNVDVSKLAKVIVDQYAEQIRGPKGNTGRSGEKGAAGERGTAGLTGLKGSAGSQGAAGIRGKNGKNGTATPGNGVSADEIDRYIEEAVARAVSALPVTESNRTPISTIPEGKIFASGDCVELNPLKKTVSANLTFGGSICRDGVPYGTVSYIQRCKYIGISTENDLSGKRVNIGSRLTFAVGKRKVTIQPGCKIKDDKYYYPTRIFWSSK